jgi:hypothetical protein
MGDMGVLDDAIREHLELKRRLGTSEEELKQKESEAFGRGKPAPAAPEAATDLEEPPAALAPEAPVAETSAPEAPVPEEQAPEARVAEERPPDTVEHEPVTDAVPEPEPEALAPSEPEPAPVPAEDFEPDEVLPEDALEPEPPPTSAQQEDPLEETPEFLEETPDHDRLWFEQKPPKDFDFDD